MEKWPWNGLSPSWFLFLICWHIFLSFLGHILPVPIWGLQIRFTKWFRHHLESTVALESLKLCLHTRNNPWRAGCEWGSIRPVGCSIECIFWEKHRRVLQSLLHPWKSRYLALPHGVCWELCVQTDGLKGVGKVLPLPSASVSTIPP